MSEDYVHVDNVTEFVLDNWFLEVDDLLSYIKDRASKDIKFCKELHEGLKKLRWRDLMVKVLMYNVGGRNENNLE